MSFLFHSYPETSGRGKSSCQFTLGGAYAAMGGVKNTNLSYEFFDEDAVGRQYFRDMLVRAQAKARSESKREGPFTVHIRARLHYVTKPCDT